MEIKIQNLHNQAVDAALDHNWQKAIELHKKILDISPNNIDAFLGLGFAYMQFGDLTQAKNYYKKALDVDPINIIARNNLDKLVILSKKGHSHATVDKNDFVMNPEIFMNIKGKTRTIVLLNLGQSEVIAGLKIGERVFLKNKKRRLEIRNKKEEYVGCLPDDISKRLLFFLESSSEYEVIIKEATKSNVEIFVRELKKGSKVKNFISFPDNIQDDMKRIIGKQDDDEESIEVIELTDDDFEEDAVDDIDRLASELDEDEDDTFLSELEDEDDDDEDEE